MGDARMSRSIEPEIIVIDDDDENDQDEIQSFSDNSSEGKAGHGVSGTKRCNARITMESKPSSTSSATSVNGSLVDIFMEVANVADKSVAQRFISESNSDLQLAISRFLEQQNDHKAALQNDPIVQSEKAKKEPKSLTNPMPLPRVHSNNPTTTKFATAIKSSTLNPYSKNQKRPPQEFKNQKQRGLERTDHFVDPEFPPIVQSLDGRRRVDSTEGTQVVHCLCNIPASARQVQSDGPNYGRFYLCCGQKQKRQFHSSDPKAADSSTKKTARCDFFRWDREGSLGASTMEQDGYGSARFSLLAWQYFGPSTGSCLYNAKTGIDASQVAQGAVGNCWFLSALAVVAEKPYLIRQVMPHSELNDKGMYSVNFCLDGRWTTIVVDSVLPVVVKDIKGNDKANKKRRATDSTTEIKLRGREGVPFDLSPQTMVAFPAFCATPKGQLWPALVEKAYAKAHGSYSQLSGGFIAEGLFDLTGAPFETILFDGPALDREELWSRLKSFNEEGFLMGVATSKGGDGLVGGHAYSILDVIEVPDKLVGEQSKMTDFFTPNRKRKRLRVDDDQNDEDGDGVIFLGTRTTIRLIRIRNPWAKREWTSSWSAKSEQWTKSLRKIIGPDSYKQNDGTFFMSFDDMLDRFHHMDVGKARKGWVHNELDGQFQGGRDPLHSSNCYFRIVSKEKTPTFISIVQPKKRAQAGNRFWYIDPSFIILKRKFGSPLTSENGWEHEGSSLVGVKRISSLEVSLDPEYEYLCVPFSCLAGGKRTGEASPFRLCSYSAANINCSAVAMDGGCMQRAVSVLHDELLKCEHRLLYPVTKSGSLICVQCQGCVFFSIINGSRSQYITMKFTLNFARGIVCAFGNGDTHDIAPNSQRLIAWASGDGKFSAATTLGFKYLVDTVSTKADYYIGTARNGTAVPASLRMKVPLSRQSEMLLSKIDESTISNRGGDTIDTYLWIPQIGSASSRGRGWSSRSLRETQPGPRGPPSSAHVASRDYADPLRRDSQLTHEEKKEIYSEARRPVEALEKELKDCKQIMKQATNFTTSQYRTTAARAKELESKLIPAAKHNASQYVFHLNNSAGDLGREDGSGMLTLDMHGLYVKEAQRKIEEVILPILPVIKKMRLIVGRGSHSKDGVARLKHAICHYIENHERGSNMRVEPLARNPGVIEVKWRDGGRRHEIILE